MALMLALFGSVIAARSIAVSFAWSPTIDEHYHLERGLRYWTGDLTGIELNDPPLGEGLVALPLFLMGCHPTHTEGSHHVLMAQLPRYSPQLLQSVVAGWKALLFLPALAVAWLWARRLYGAAAGWAACALLTAEPNFAAHLPLATVDVPGVTAILLASYLAWRYFETGGVARLVLATVASATAMMVKHTAVILPGVWLLYAAAYWVRIPWQAGSDTWREARSALPRRALALCGAAAVGALTIWALTGFDVSRPYTHPFWPQTSPRLFALLNRRWPAGIYLSSFIYGYVHGKEGHAAYLLGNISLAGWWYYFPVVAAYKVPISVAVVAVVGVASLVAKRLRTAEWSLAAAAAAWTVFLIKSRVNIGFRHFLPAYAFLLLLSVRWLAPRPNAAVPRTKLWLAWGAIAVTAIHGALWHPDYISYLNAPRSADHPAYLAISDSNVDWGQGLKEVRRWLDSKGGDGASAQAADPVYLMPFLALQPDPALLTTYIGGRATVLRQDVTKLPEQGTLLVSPIQLTGQYGASPAVRALSRLRPDGQIGHGAVLIYDLAKAATASSR
jgi:hypothetical protein